MLVGTDCFSKMHGGGEVYVRNLAKGLLAGNHAVIYISIVVDDIQKSEQIRLNNEVVEEWQWFFPRQWFQADIDLKSHLIKSIAGKIREVNPDIIHAHGWKRYTCLGAVLANKPCIITAHHGGIVCPAGALLRADDTICRVPAHDTNCLQCCVKQVPGWRIWYLLLRHIPLFTRLKFGKYIRKFLFVPFLTPLGVVTHEINEKIRAVSDIGKYANKLIAPSPAIGEALIRNGIPIGKIHVVAHGISRLPHVPLSKDFNDRPLRFVFIGRINRVKGLHILLQACARLPLGSYELHVVGYPSTRQEKRYYDGLRRKYSLKNMIWHGYKLADDVAKILCVCDVMIHPAICLEVYGLTIAESLSVGRPVIATRCGGPEIQIQDGINGVLIPPNDSHALVQTMKRLIDQPELVQSMADNIEKVNDIAAHIVEIEKIYGYEIGQGCMNRCNSKSEHENKTL